MAPFNGRAVDLAGPLGQIEVARGSLRERRHRVWPWGAVTGLPEAEQVLWGRLAAENVGVDTGGGGADTKSSLDPGAVQLAVATYLVVPESPLTVPRCQSPHQ